jgi:3-oxoacyl-[acyl-carrier protein] reductase/pteridine reductase
VGEYDQVEKMAQKVLDKFGGIDILINNASRFKPSPFPTDDIAAWKKTTSILIDGPFYCANFFTPGMLEKGEGVIINIVDLSIYESWPKFGAHVVGKSALLAFTRQMALELGPAVRSNAIAPGPVLPPPSYSPEKIERTAKKTLLNRWGSPKDVTRTVLFLIESDYITGEVIVVDAGERYGHRKHEEG